MGLTYAQYDSLMRDYDRQRLIHKRELDERTSEIYDKFPQIKEINDTISSLSVATAKQLLTDASVDTDALKAETASRIDALSKKKAAILQENGYDEDYLSMKYACADCKDTGYINGQKCHCLTNSIIEILYQQSNIREVLKYENFKTFSFKHFDNRITDSATGMTAFDNMHQVVDTCRDFIEHFDTQYKSLYLYGGTGVGKTFLTNCIAKELIDQSYSVIYVSSIRLFEILANSTFKKDSSRLYNDLADNLNQCDLLIIDDLGTELINSFTASSLFNCINERHLKQKSVIISTNLSLAELRANYSERVFSRITSNYTLLKIYGDDLRVKLR